MSEPSGLLTMVGPRGRSELSPEANRSWPSSSQRGAVALTPAGLTCRAGAVPSADTIHTELLSPLVASMRRLTENATHLPSGESIGDPTVRTR
jgi:hypothetical protein